MHLQKAEIGQTLRHALQRDANEVSPAESMNFAIVAGRLDKTNIGNAKDQLRLFGKREPINFTVGDVPLTLRARAINIFNDYTWSAQSSGLFFYNFRRSYSLTLRATL